MTLRSSCDTKAIVSVEKAASARQTYDYFISGLRVSSDVRLPSAIPAPESTGVPDVVICEGAVPDLLNDAEHFGAIVQIAADSVRFDYAGTMKVLVENGCRITVQRYNGAVEGDVVLLLLGTTFAILLQQRGRVVLHASAVAAGDRAMLFCGASGAGKSTMAALLSRRGYPLLNDDVCNLSRTDDGRYVVYPDGRMLKLWSQSLDHLQVHAPEHLRIRTDAEKFYVAPESVDLTPRVIGGVYILDALPEGEPPLLSRLSTAEAVSELTANAYRPSLVQAMKMQKEYFNASASIVRSGGVFRLSRAKEFSQADAVLDLLIASWNSHEPDTVPTQYVGSHAGN